MIEKLCCNSCGGQLDVAEQVRFLTCHYCGLILAVDRSETITFTRVIEQLSEPAEVKDLAKARRSLMGSQEIDGSDRCWDSEQVRNRIGTRDGGERNVGPLFGVIAVIVSCSLVTVLFPILVQSGGMFFIMAGVAGLGIVQAVVLVGNKHAFKRLGKRHEKTTREQRQVAAEIGR